MQQPVAQKKSAESVVNMKINEIILEASRFNPDGSFNTFDDEANEFDELEGSLTGDGEGFGGTMTDLGVACGLALGRDGALYRAVGQSLAQGRGYRFRGEREKHVFPGLPLFLAGIEKSMGPVLDAVGLLKK